MGSSNEDSQNEGKEINLHPVESGPSVIDILHSVLTLDTFHTLIANK